MDTEFPALRKTSSGATPSPSARGRQRDASPLPPRQAADARSPLPGCLDAWLPRMPNSMIFLTGSAKRSWPAFSSTKDIILGQLSKPVVPGQLELRLLHRDAGVPAMTVARLPAQARQVSAQQPDGGHPAGAAGFLQLPRFFPEMLPACTTGGNGTCLFLSPIQEEFAEAFLKTCRMAARPKFDSSR